MVILRRTSLFVVLLGAALVLGGAQIVIAQTSSQVEISGGQGVVSVVSAPGGISSSSGAPTDGGAPQASVWPYTCTFYVGVTLDSFISTTTPKPGSYYNLVCNPTPGSGATLIADPIYLYDPGGPLVPGEPNLVTSLQVREAAQNIVNPTDLTIGVSPDAQQITGLETWFWPEGDRSPQTVSATAGPLTVTIEAQYVETEFVVPGTETESITCTEFVEWTPGATESPCATTFFEETPAQIIEAHSTWRLVWWDNAAQTTPVELGFITETQVDVVEVVDLEAVITRSR